MIYWLINYLNCNGYYFNGSGFSYYACNYSEFIYSNQQPHRSHSQRRSRNRRRKKKLAAKSNENALQGGKNLIKGQETKIQEIEGNKLITKKEGGNGTTLTKMFAGVQEPLMLDTKSAWTDLGELTNTKSLTQNLIKSQVKPAKEMEQISLNKKVSNQVGKTAHETAVDIQQNGSIKANQIKFSVNDPNTPEFLQSLAEAFHSEIGLMLSRLVAQASIRPIHNDNDLMVAKIHLENNPKISDDLFEFIRTELVGWIGVYQQEVMNTPIFHNITKHDCYLTIVCDNKYAYKCVKRCVEDLAQMKTIGSVKVLTLPPITPTIYCFDAKYEGITSDPNLFLSQLHLHRPKLYSNDWLVASHKVCSEERRTYFILLIDERSALALNFHYNRSFYVCMQQVTFRNRGIVSKSI